MDSLPQRIEAAEGPSDELDEAIHRARFPSMAFDWCDEDESPACYWDYNGVARRCPAYTSSIDAAMTLVPEGWAYRVWHSENRKHASATVDTSHPINRACFAESVTPALALCAAALRAKEQPNEG